MQKLPVVSDTVRYQNNKGPYPPIYQPRKNYKPLILKLILVLIIIIILIIISIILIKIFVLKKEEKCSSGFYHPEDESTNSNCFHCTLSNCDKCEGKKNNDICTKCIEGFNPEYNDNNEIIKCVFSSVKPTNNLNIEISCDDNCIECDTTKKKCTKCKAGYFVANDSSNKLNCDECSLMNCEKCEGNKNNDKCTKCNSGYVPTYNDKNKIIKCDLKKEETTVIEPDISCGDDCLDCDKIGKKCAQCKTGYFIPDDNSNKLICEKCSLMNCGKCEGNKNNDVCKKCLNGFYPEYNSKNEIINCGLKSVETTIIENISCGDDCLECDKIGKKCSKCKDGYFVPDDSINKLICEKCSLNNCKRCEGNKNDNICTSCENNYIAKYDPYRGIKYCNERCQTGENNKCKECDFTKNECSSCNSGFYIPSDDDLKLECQSCALEHCIICHGTKNLPICDLCDNNYKPIFENNIIKSCQYQEPITCDLGDGDKCLTCSKTEKNKCASCNPKYILVDGLCQLDSFWILNDDEDEPDYDFVSFRAKYITDADKKIPLVDETRRDYVKQMKVDGVLQDLSNLDEKAQYLFDNTKKEHIVEMWLDVDYNTLRNLFYINNYIKEVFFTKVKNTQNIKLTTFRSMFYKCRNLAYIDISNIDTKDAYYIDYMFAHCNSLKTLDLSKNNFENVQMAMFAFSYCYSLTSINLNTPFTNLEIFNYSFYDTHSLTSLDLSKMKPKKLKLCFHMLSECSSLAYVNLDNFKVDQVEDLHGFFHNNNKLTSVDLSQFNTQNCKDMRWMFFNCTSLKYLDLSSFDTSQVTDMIEMFSYCHSLTSINFGNKFNTWKVTNMSAMFFNLTSITSLDLRVFDTRNVKCMQYMFSFCSSAKKIDVSSFDTSQVTTFDHLFSYCSSLTSVDFSNFNFTTNEKHYTSPRLIHYCSSLKYIDITPIKKIFKDFFNGIPNTGGTVRASSTLQYYLLTSGIKVLLNWDWEIIKG